MSASHYVSVSFYFFQCTSTYCLAANRFAYFAFNLHTFVLKYFKLPLIPWTTVNCFKLNFCIHILYCYITCIDSPLKSKLAYKMFNLKYTEGEFFFQKITFSLLNIKKETRISYFLRMHFFSLSIIFPIITQMRFINPPFLPWRDYLQLLHPHFSLINQYLIT